MQSKIHGNSGVFRPRELEEMWEELKRGDTPAETAVEREQRAIAILHRHRLRQAVMKKSGPRADGIAKPGWPG